MPLPDIAELKAIAARARAHAERFALPLREQRWGGGAGEFAGAGAGSSLDFQDHRAYVPGDAPRHINWQAYARSGHYTLKLYREEVRPVVEILLDVSESMFADDGKAVRVAELLYFLLASATRAGASTSLILLKGPHWQVVDRDALHRHGWTDLALALPPTEAAAPPGLGQIPLRARSLRVLLSDLLFAANPEPLLHALVRGQGRAVVLAPFAPSESAPEWSGDCEFLDTESAALHRRHIDPGLLRRYLASYQEHFARWKAAALRTRIPLARVPSSPPFEAALTLEALPSCALIFV